MARRTTSLTKKRTTIREAGPAEIAERAPFNAPRRGGRAKLAELPVPEMSVTDAFFLGGEGSAAKVADPITTEPVKARRGRKPKSQSEPEVLTTDDEHLETAKSPAQDTKSLEGHEQLEMDAGTASTPSAPPRQKRRGRQEKVDEPSPASMGTAAAAPNTQSSAARWDVDTGTATFDWPSIEQVAATDGPNQAMAKLLLAARAEGANSRWPF